MKDDSKVSFLRVPSHIFLHHIDKQIRHFHSFPLTPEAEPWTGNTGRRRCRSSRVVFDFKSALRMWAGETHGCRQDRALRAVAWEEEGLLPGDALTAPLILIALSILLAHPLPSPHMLASHWAPVPGRLSLDSKIRRGKEECRAGRNGWSAWGRMYVTNWECSQDPLAEASREWEIRGACSPEAGGACPWRQSTCYSCVPLGEGQRMQQLPL